MILNDNGKFILHSDDMENPDSKKIHGKHVTEKEYDIARSLIEKNILKRQKCFNCETTNDQYYWKLEMPENMPEFRDHIYNITAVPKTNIFILKKYAWSKGGIRCNCWPTLDTSGTPVCQVKDVCECPCHNNTLYDVCENNFPLGQVSDKALPCVPDQPGVNFEDIQEATEKVVKTLLVCHEPNCDLKTSKWLCEGTFLCSWCHGKCQSQEKCKGIMGQPILNNTTDADNSLTTEHSIAIAVCVSVLVITIVVGLTILIYCKRFRKPSKPEQDIPIPNRYIETCRTRHSSQETKSSMPHEYASPYDTHIPNSTPHYDNATPNGIPAHISFHLGQSLKIVANVFTGIAGTGTSTHTGQGGTGSQMGGTGSQMGGAGSQMGGVGPQNGKSQNKDEIYNAIQQTGLYLSSNGGTCGNSSNPNPQISTTSGQLNGRAPVGPTSSGENHARIPMYDVHNTSSIYDVGYTSSAECSEQGSEYPILQTNYPRRNSLAQHHVDGVDDTQGYYV